MGQMSSQRIRYLRTSDGVKSGRSLSGLRGVLVMTQLAASLAVLAAAGLLVRAQGRLSDLGVGYDLKSIVVTRVSSPIARDNSQGGAFSRTLIERVEALAGVRSIAVANSAPFQGSATEAVRTEAASAPHEWHPVRIRRVSPSYFDIFAVRIIRGRIFTADEIRPSSDLAPVVISEALARALWRSGDPVGARIHTKNSKILQVVGVAADTSSVQPGERDGPVIYQPLHPTSLADGVLIVRAMGSGDTLVPAIRATIRTLDPQQAPAPETVAAIVDRLADRYAFILKVGSIPAVLAFVLCLLGIYGVAAFSAAQRTREVGIRMALGARRQDIILLLGQSVAWPLLVGLPVGFALGAGLGVLFDRAHLLLGVSAMDPLSHAAAALLIAVTVIVATLIPARRASRLDPWRSLRVE